MGCPGYTPAQNSLSSSPQTLAILVGPTLPHPWPSRILSCSPVPWKPFLTSHPTLTHSPLRGLLLVRTCMLLSALGELTLPCAPVSPELIATRPVLAVCGSWASCQFTVLAVQWACSCVLQVASLPGNFYEVAAAVAAEFVMRRGRGDETWRVEGGFFFRKRKGCFWHVGVSAGWAV